MEKRKKVIKKSVNYAKNNFGIERNDLKKIFDPIFFDSDSIIECTELTLFNETVKKFVESDIKVIKDAVTKHKAFFEEIFEETRNVLFGDIIETVQPPTYPQIETPKNDLNFKITKYEPFAFSNSSKKNISYVNASLQALFNCNSFYKILMSENGLQSSTGISDQNEISKIEKSNNLMKILKDLCQNQTKIKDAQKLREAIPEFDNTENQDVKFFLAKLVELCIPLRELCTYKMKKTSKCKVCKHENVKEDNHIGFEEPMINYCYSLKEILKKNWSSVADVVVKCQNCDIETSHSITENVANSPEIVLVTLDRFEKVWDFSSAKHIVTKRTQKVHANNQIEIATTTCQLKSIIIHIGRTIDKAQYKADLVQPDGSYVRIHDEKIIVVKEKSDSGYAFLYEICNDVIPNINTSNDTPKPTKSLTNIENTPTCMTQNTPIQLHTPSTPLPSKEITEDDIIKLLGQCGRHKPNALANCLGVSRNSLVRLIAEKHIVFPKVASITCDFCEMITEKNSNSKNTKDDINEQIFSIVKSSCGQHSQSSMANMLNVSQKSLNRKINAEKVNFDLPKSMKAPCEFCNFIVTWKETPFITPAGKKRRKELFKVNDSTPTTSQKPDNHDNLAPKNLFDELGVASVDVIREFEVSNELQSKIQDALFEKAEDYLRKKCQENRKNGINCKILYQIFGPEGLLYIRRNESFPNEIAEYVEKHESFFAKLLSDIMDMLEGNELNNSKYEIPEKLQSEIKDANFVRVKNYLTKHYSEQDDNGQNNITMQNIFGSDGLSHMKEYRSFPIELRGITVKHRSFFGPLLKDILKLLDRDIIKFKKSFKKCSEQEQRRRLQSIYDVLDVVSKEGDITTEDLLFTLIHNYFHSTQKGNNRKIAHIIDTLAKHGENFTEEFRPKIPKDEVLFVKSELLLSQAKFNTLRDVYSPYVKIPCIDNIREYTKTLVPNSYDFVIDDVKVGKMFDIAQVIKTGVENSLHHWDDDPKKVPPILHLKGGYGGDGFSEEANRMGADIDLNTGSRYIIGFKPSRLMYYPNPDRPWEKIEIFVEDSQSSKTMIPIAIVAGKENQKLMKDIWRPILDEIKKMKEFTVNFHGREIKIKFQNPKFIGDGKGFCNLLCVNGAYCYLCDLSKNDGQTIKMVKEGMPITRTVKKINDAYAELEAGWQKAVDKGKTTLSFLKYYNTVERGGITGEPIVKEDELDINNTPANHLYSHVFDQFKTLFYQWHSRIRTQSGKTVADEKMDLLRGVRTERKKKKKQQISFTKTEIKTQMCENCKKPYQGFTRLYTHLRKTKCGKEYGLSRVNKIKIDRDDEAKLRKQSKPKSDHEKILKESKDYFTFIVKRDLGIACNQVNIIAFLERNYVLRAFYFFMYFSCKYLGQSCGTRCNY